MGETTTGAGLGRKPRRGDRLAVDVLGYGAGMQGHRTFGRCVALPLAFAAVVTACGEPPVPVHAFEASTEPLRDEEPYEPYELDANDTCRWLDDGRLFVETVSDSLRSYTSVTRLWIRFQPPDHPLVEAASWNEEVTWGSRWPHGWREGRSWVSSDGVGLAEPGGPDLTIDIEYTYLDSGSPERSGRRFVVRADALVRDED